MGRASVSIDADARASSRDDAADEAAYTKNMCSSLLKYFTFAIKNVKSYSVNWGETLAKHRNVRGLVVRCDVCRDKFNEVKIVFV